MTDLYVLGGRQRGLRPLAAGTQDWYEYDQGLLLALDTEAGQAKTLVSYVSPPSVCPPEEPAILFKSGTLDGDTLYMCTQTEVLIYRVPDFERIGYISLPAFNDVHHVRPTATGTLLVAITGLDLVMELSRDGKVLNEWTTLPEQPTWSRFSRTIDYRRIASTKPHLSHPNHVFCIGDEVWATRFQQKDAISLTQPGRRIDIGVERPHDGYVHEGHVYFTTVNGQIVVADVATLKVVETIDLTTMHPRSTLLGWCRGIHFADGLLWVGFSRIRPTKFRENVGWVARGFKRDLGTHVGAYDLAARRSVAEVDVERFGLGAIFSVLPQRPSDVSSARASRPAEFSAVSV